MRIFASLPAILALALVPASCGTTVVPSSSGTTSGATTATATTCRNLQGCAFPDAGFTDYTCVFEDACVGPTYCLNASQPAQCMKDADCASQAGTYCRLCTPGGSGLCLPQCDGGPCAPPVLQTCTSDDACAGKYCINGFCSNLGYCMNCT